MGSLSGEEDFNRLRVIDFGGESVTHIDAELYKRHFSSGYIWSTTFGQRSGTLRLYFINKTTEVPEGIVPVGYEVEDKEILILGEAGEKLGFNQLGQIAVRSLFPRRDIGGILN